MAKKQFKSESKRLLDLMVNSIYTHKEIFLREIISNASDAIDKLCYISLTDDKVGLTRDDFRIRVETDKNARTITVSDNGVGMTAAELESNLGVIAKSGSLQFKRDMGESESDIDIIGQFGVGFYSAFMIASRVTVISRAYGEDTASKWVSEGSDGYTITPCEKDAPGTDVIMEVKPDTDDENYSEYLEEYTLHSLVRKYSDYIRWPIVMEVTKSRRVDGEPDESGKPQTTWEDYTELETVNSRVPIWQRPKSETSEEDCASFYKEEFADNDDPISVIRVSAEGAVSYKAMLFIPENAPANYFTRDYEPGLKLYASGVMIMERCSALLPEYFRFTRGVVDSPDLSLNISRELLQHDRQLKTIASNIEKKIKTELTRIQTDYPDRYAQFYKSFGIQLKYGVLSDYGANKDNLKDLLMYYSAAQEKLITLAQYVADMPDEQKYIYYACGENTSALSKLPQTEPVRDRGYDVLFMTEDVDEFVVRTLERFGEKEFRSVTSDDLGLQSDDEKKTTEKLETDNRGALDFIKESLGGKVAAVRISSKLKTHPVCLTTQGGVTLEMERYFNSVTANLGAPVTAERVLELNAAHPVFKAVVESFDKDKEKCKKYAELLYGQALLIAGIPPEDPVAFAELICETMSS
jgi:molecular chaperone HtpG